MKIINIELYLVFKSDELKIKCLDKLTDEGYILDVISSLNQMN